MPDEHFIFHDCIFEIDERIFEFDKVVFDFSDFKSFDKILRPFCPFLGSLSWPKVLASFWTKNGPQVPKMKIFKK